VRFITYVAIGGVTIGVAALLLALSIVRGFSQEIQEKIIGFGAHVQVESMHDAPLERAASLEARFAAWPEVSSVMPAVQEFALLRRDRDDIDGVILWGVRDVPQYLAESVIQGRAAFTPDERGLPGIIIGQDLATNLGAGVGDMLTSFAQRTENSVTLATVPRIRQFHVAGIFETHLQNFDELYVLLDLDEARDLFDYSEDQVTRFDIMLFDPEEAMEVAARVDLEVGFPVMARTIFEVFRGLFAWVDLQENIIPVVISVIIIVAAFNIIAILMMLILEKTREIGVLMSLGATKQSVRRIFVFLGVAIGAIGTILGSSIALIVALVQQRYGVIPLPAEAYYIDKAPIDLSALDFGIVAVVTIILCLLAAYIPSRVAARIEPIKAIRL
jgi:lipoprotein-releasing system permease protein